MEIFRNSQKNTCTFSLSPLLLTGKYTLLKQQQSYTLEGDENLRFKCFESCEKVFASAAVISSPSENFFLLKASFNHSSLKDYIVSGFSSKRGSAGEASPLPARWPPNCLTHNTIQNAQLLPLKLNTWCSKLATFSTLYMYIHTPTLPPSINSPPNKVKPCMTISNFHYNNCSMPFSCHIQLTSFWVK